MVKDLRAIEAKRGRGLTGEELAYYVFAGYLPAGNYAECCSYLPAAYEYLRTAEAHPKDCLVELWENLFHVWVPMHRDELQRDGRLESVEAEMRAIFHARLQAWVSGSDSVSLACNMLEWCIVFLCSALVADEHRALLEQLSCGNVYARMLFISMHPVNTPNFPYIPKDKPDCYRSGAEVRVLIRDVLPDAQLRAFLDTLQADVLECHLNGRISDELFAYWADALETADAASAHFPGGPACMPEA